MSANICTYLTASPIVSMAMYHITMAMYPYHHGNVSLSPRQCWDIPVACVLTAVMSNGDTRASNRFFRLSRNLQRSSKSGTSCKTCCNHTMEGCVIGGEGAGTHQALLHSSQLLCYLPSIQQCVTPIIPPRPLAPTPPSHSPDPRPRPAHHGCETQVMKTISNIDHLKYRPSHTTNLRSINSSILA